MCPSQDWSELGQNWSEQLVEMSLWRAGCLRRINVGSGLAWACTLADYAYVMTDRLACGSSCSLVSVSGARFGDGMFCFYMPYLTEPRTAMSLILARISCSDQQCIGYAIRSCPPGALR